MKLNYQLKTIIVTYFDSKSFIGFGSTGSSYTLYDQSVIKLPARTIYLKNHSYYTGQKLKYNVGIGGTGILVSNTINPADAFPLQDNQDVYAVNLGQNFVGLSTVGYTTSTGIGATLNSLYFFDDFVVTGAAHSLTTVNEEVIGKIENFTLNVITEEALLIKRW